MLIKTLAVAKKSFSPICLLLVSLVVGGCVAKSPYRFQAFAVAPSAQITPAALYSVGSDVSSVAQLKEHTRVMVAPLNHLAVDLTYLDEQADRLVSSLENYLLAQGAVVVDSVFFEQHWSIQTRDNLSFYDPQSLDFNQSQYDAAVLKTLASISKETPVDVFLFPSIKEVGVIVSQSKASWSGIERNVNLKHPPADTRHLRMANEHFVWSGELTGLSFGVHAVDSAGAEIYSGVGGIGFRDAVIAQPKNGRYSYKRIAVIRQKGNPIGNQANLLEGMEKALSGYIPKTNTNTHTAANERPSPL